MGGAGVETGTVRGQEVTEARVVEEKGACHGGPVGPGWRLNISSCWRDRTAATAVGKAGACCMRHNRS